MKRAKTGTLATTAESLPTRERELKHALLIGEVSPNGRSLHGSVN